MQAGRVGDAALPIKLTLRKQDDLDSDGKELPFTLGSSVGDVRAAVAKHFAEAPERVDLLLSGCVALDDASCLGDYGLVGGEKAKADVDVVITPEAAEGKPGKDDKAKEKDKPADGKAAAPVYEGPVRLTVSNILPGVHVELGEWLSCDVWRCSCFQLMLRRRAFCARVMRRLDVTAASDTAICNVLLLLSACLQTPTRATLCGCWRTRFAMRSSALAARPRSALAQGRP